MRHDGLLPTRKHHGTRRRGGLFRSKNQAVALLSAGLICTLIASFTILLRMRHPGDNDQAAAEYLYAAPSPQFCSRVRPPLVCAHGGDSHHYPPNSRSAFEAAINLGVDCVEIDVVQTSDGQLVVLHTRELQQLMGNRLKPGIQVGDFSWRQLQQLSWPSGDTVMLARDVILLTCPFVTTVILDIKTYQDSSDQAYDELLIAGKVVELIHETGCQNCLVWAKSDKVITSIMESSPGQRSGYVLMNTPAARSFGLDQPLRMKSPGVVGAYFGMVTDQLVNLLHRNSKQLFAWTVNEAADMKDLLDLSVDAIVTNKPADLKEAIEWRVERCGGTASNRHVQFVQHAELL